MIAGRGLRWRAGLIPQVVVHSVARLVVVDDSSRAITDDVLGGCAIVLTVGRGVPKIDLLWDDQPGDDGCRYERPAGPKHGQRACGRQGDAGCGPHDVTPQVDRS